MRVPTAAMSRDAMTLRGRWGIPPPLALSLNGFFAGNNLLARRTANIAGRRIELYRSPVGHVSTMDRVVKISIRLAFLEKVCLTRSGKLTLLGRGGYNKELLDSILQDAHPVCPAIVSFACPVALPYGNESPGLTSCPPHSR